ncbi:MAG: glycosyltransferase [candidate division Zixibacteria bacterium]|nr:glycosyltransferase [candidate division Zixibacteria bacterium]
MASKKIKVLHTVLNLGFAGLERVVTELSMATDKDIYDVEVCCFQRKGYFADILEKSGVTVSLIPRKESGTDWSLPRKLAKFAKDKEVQVLHCHTGTFWFSALAGKLGRIPALIYTEHGRFLVEPFVRLAEDFVSARLADKSIAVSAELESYMVEKVKFPAKKMAVILNGVNTMTFLPGPKPENLLQEFKLSPKTKILGCVASFNTVKDHATMLDVFKIIKEEYDDIALLLVGDGMLRDKIEAKIESLGLGDSVIMTGKRKDVQDLLRLMDVFLLFSLSEGTSMSIAEAMASGLPAVVTNVGGNPSLVDNDVNGILVETKQPRNMAKAVLSLILDEKRMAEFSSAAVEKVKRAYSVDVMARQYSDVYMEILNKKGALS